MYYLSDPAYVLKPVSLIVSVILSKIDKLCTSRDRESKSWRERVCGWEREREKDCNIKEREIVCVEEI